MKHTQLIMGMPITIEIVDEASSQVYDEAFAYFRTIDEIFSTYKPASEISKINRGELLKPEFSMEMQTVLALCKQTKKETNGYFNIETPAGILDPSGLVKGWAIQQASLKLLDKGFKNFYIEAGGDIQTSGKNNEGNIWNIGIKNPFNSKEIVKIIYISEKGVATSGTYERGQHIYNPHKNSTIPNDHDIISLTVIGSNIYEADRFATAAFAMGRDGIHFIEKLKGFEGYMIDKDGVGTETSGFINYSNLPNS